jgi:ABC-2 type transport system permease protein
LTIFCLSNGEISISREDVPASNYSLIMSAFCWMSDEEVPFDVRRPKPADRKIYLGVPGMLAVKWGFTGAVPFIMAVLYILLWIRRRGR